MTTLLAFLFTLAVLIVFHELGHYYIARRAGVRVLRFSVGFGKVIARRVDRHGTEWALSAIPLGGYVKMLDEREAPVPADQLDQAFNRKSLGARAAIVAAGPLANFLLAILLFWGLFLTGVPILKPVLGDPPEGTPAAQAGIQAGDRVLSINGETVESWQDVHWLTLRHGIAGAPLRLEIQNARGHLATPTLTLAQRDEEFERNPLRAYGLVRYLPPLEPVLGDLTATGAASRAGLSSGDRILAIDGVEPERWDDVVKTVRAAPGRPLDITIERDGVRLSMRVTPEVAHERGQEIGRIGAAPYIDPTLLEDLHGVARYGALDSGYRALARTWELSVFSLEMLGRMVLGQASLKNLSGPITIADYAGQSAQIGLAAFVAFLALVSVSLGVINLLPVPLLDGGHLLYYLAEFLTGRPVSERAQIIGQKIGIFLLGLLMFFAIYNDLQRLFVG
jgi:regulator of sigma E protease